MILKVMRRIVHQADTNHPKVTDEVSFFDDFDYISEKKQDIKDTEKPCGAYAASFFTSEDSKMVLAVWLMRYNNVITRYLVIDLSYDVYLMSNEGKTVERLN